jgi:UDP-GlcNAc:undecaprenyl-phosphate GlcNAc-1-phosphate transferase
MMLSIFIALSLLCFLFFTIHKKIADFFDFFDYPDNKNKTHSVKTPYTGGVGYLIFFFFSSFLFKSYENQFFIFQTNFKNIIVIYFFFISIFFIGLIDDKFFLKPINKLVSLSLVFFLFLNFVPEFQLTNLKFLNYLIDINYFSILFTIFCLLAFSQSFNMYDGINCQSSIYLIFVFFIIGFLSNSFFFYFQILYFIFFLINNSNNKIFLGDNGTYLISIIISIFFIDLYKLSLIQIEQIILIMFVPGIDMVRLFFIRIANNKSPFVGDKNHLHHLIINKYAQIKTNFINILICSIKTLFIIKYNPVIGIFILTLIYIFLIFITKYK